jgi:alkanesulfonate monooxygenase SsuD/methylene tetrahydromethanopterin reductase-like flavin-dependent oxidoreductase (luciferase family)
MSSTTFAIRGPGGEPIRFAYWVPNVSGGLVISNIEQRTSWDIDYNRKPAQTAENNGFDYALSQIRFTAGCRLNSGRECWFLRTLVPERYSIASS